MSILPARVGQNQQEAKNGLCIPKHLQQRELYSIGVFTIYSLLQSVLKYLMPLNKDMSLMRHIRRAAYICTQISIFEQEIVLPLFDIQLPKLQPSDLTKRKTIDYTYRASEGKALSHVP